MINAVGQNGDLVFAKTVFLSPTANNLIRSLVKINDDNGASSINLHGCDYFTALFYLEEYYKKLKGSGGITIIFGRG